MGMLAAAAGACSGTSSTNSQYGAEAGTVATHPATGGSADDAVPGTGGRGEANAGGTAGTGGADGSTGGAGSGGLAGGGPTGGSSHMGGSGPTGGSSHMGGSSHTGGSSQTGGSGVGGDPVGGSGGHGTGGRAGDATGGVGGGSSGGDATGGTATGGVDAGGVENGGGETGGVEAAGAATGGAATAGAGPCEDPGTIHSGGTTYCDNISVDLDGYHFGIWMNKPESGCMTVFGDEATFKAEWTDASDFFARAGLEYDATLPHDQVGTFSSEFAFTGTGSGAVLIGVHGRMHDPPVDFYILEDWVNEPDGTLPISYQSRGTITVDGSTYSVYHTQVGDGATPWYETFSIRTESRHCGHLSISEHLSQWADMGLHMGALASVELYVEGLGGSGRYEFTRATLTVQ